MQAQDTGPQPPPEDGAVRSPLDVQEPLPAAAQSLLRRVAAGEELSPDEESALFAALRPVLGTPQEPAGNARGFWARLPFIGRAAGGNGEA